MTVSISGRLIERAAQLSDRARMVLGLIDGGQPWLAWACTSPMAHYHFVDELTLLAEVQKGLHSASLVFLPRAGLSISPLKLMSLETDTLRLLARGESGDTIERHAAELGHALQTDQLLTNDQLASTNGFLESLGVGQATLFKLQDLNDRLALFTLMSSRSDAVAGPALQAEAAAFAVQQARTVAQFCDYYQFFLLTAGTSDVPHADPAVRAQMAEAALYRLLPLIFGRLDGLQLSASPLQDRELMSAIRQWQAGGRSVGFPNVSQAALQMVAHGGYRGEESPAAIVRLVDAYLGQANALLVRGSITAQSVGQDGASLRYTVEDATHQAQLEVSPERMVYLRSFAPLPPAAVPPAD
ncbi:hypothetical protein [Janthinobacterium sp. J1-1]|uniref:hypothetical protein n=1 Tax=Janthinobacterium sp. J1-1 TaxID=3065910 RepID=UPI002812626F|nr:hypothetical protein [Janthinobacterium sp. J1-1]